MTPPTPEPAPCPFCGNDGEIEEIAIHTVSVMCWKCHAEGPSAKGAKEIIAAWNTRRAPSAEVVADTRRLDALLFDERLDLRHRREDGKWAAYNLESEKGYGPFETPREAIDAFLAAAQGAK